MERIPCEPTPDCPVVGCPVEDKHHLYYPGYEYRTNIERKFRGLGENVVRICRRTHIAVHLDLDPLPKPSVVEMGNAIVQSSEYLSNKLRKDLKGRL